MTEDVNHKDRGTVALLAGAVSGLRGIFTSGVSPAELLAPLRGPLVFALVGGYGDAAGYLLADTFTGHTTGAFVLSAISAAAQDWRTCFLRLGGIICFFVGVFMAAVLEHFPRSRISQHLLTVTIGSEIALVILGYLAFTSHLKLAHELLVACLSLALGLQNGVWRRYGGLSVHTTYLTGMIIGLVMTETEQGLFTVQAAGGETVKSGIALPIGVWIAFVAGATIGAMFALRFHALGILGLALLLVPIFVASSFGTPYRT